MTNQAQQVSRKYLLPAAEELNTVIIPKPKIDVKANDEKLLGQMKQAAALIVVGEDEFTEPTIKTLTMLRFMPDQQKEDEGKTKAAAAPVREPKKKAPPANKEKAAPAPEKPNKTKPAPKPKAKKALKPKVKKTPKPAKLKKEAIKLPRRDEVIFDSIPKTFVRIEDVCKAANKTVKDAGGKDNLKQTLHVCKSILPLLTYAGAVVVDGDKVKRA